MLQLILNFALQNGLKGLGGYLIAHGWATQNQWTSMAGGLITLAGLLWHAWESYQHKVSTGVVAPTLPNAGAKAGLMVSLLLPALFLVRTRLWLWLTLALLTPVLFCTGCNSLIKKDVAHVWYGSGDVTSIGLSQNPATQMYELGLKRGHVAMAAVPIVFQTNGLGTVSAVIPDVVLTDEGNGRNSVFGGAGWTITLATGTNAVQTTAGGQHQPINQSTGTNLPK